jgi:hypothetical protein
MVIAFSTLEVGCKSDRGPRWMVAAVVEEEVTATGWPHEGDIDADLRLLKTCGDSFSSQLLAKTAALIESAIGRLM